MTLYELQEQYQTLLALGEDPDTDPEVFADTMEAIEGEIEDKADGYAIVMTELKGKRALLKAEIDRLTARMKACDTSIDRMNENLKNAMISTGKTKFKTDRFSFNIQKNPPKVVIDDPSRIPEAYLIPQEPKIDTAAIKNALKDADEAPLWEGIGHLEQGESLRIR